MMPCRPLALAALFAALSVWILATSERRGDPMSYATGVPK
jgi:hypothetical protein